MVFLFPVIVIGFIAMAIFCMYKAYQREKFKLPIIGIWWRKWSEHSVRRIQKVHEERAARHSGRFSF